MASVHGWLDPMRGRKIDDGIMQCLCLCVVGARYSGRTGIDVDRERGRDIELSEHGGSC